LLHVKQQTRWRRYARLAAVAALASVAGSGSALGFPGLRGGPGLDVLGLPVNGVVDPLAAATQADLAQADRLVEARVARLRDLVRDNPRALDVDDSGAPVVRGEVLALSPSPASLEIARNAGFTVIRRTSETALGVELVVLGAPDGLPARQSLKRLRKLDPAGRYDLDHIYSGAGAVAETMRGGEGAGAEGAGFRAGLLDTGVAREHPAFAGCRIEQRGFAPGGVTPADHGTAVASLIVGQRRGEAARAGPPSVLYVADVYGSGPTGGSADDILRALSWMVENHVPVINISLVGPPNLTLETAVRAAVARGALIVAPVGNDGPAAPPLYPASYPGVIAVTAVDARGRLLFEAGHALHVDFAAPGAGLNVPRARGGFAEVRGTSFAAPIVAGRLARLLLEPDPARARQAVGRLAAQARRVGGSGAASVYGFGLVEGPAPTGC
jgi:subtilisin family serine protease